MKVILLAATGGQRLRRGFPAWSNKPRHLYSFRGQIQLQRVINQLFEVGFKQQDIEIVAGFKYQKIIAFLQQNNLNNIKVKVNHNWQKSAAYTLSTAMQGINEDFMLYFADTIYKTETFSCMKSNKHKIFINGSIMKLQKNHISSVQKTIEKYANKRYIKDSRTQVTWKTRDGTGLNTMMYEIKNLIQDYEKNKIDLIEEVPSYYITDCDYFYESDEYKNMNIILRWISWTLSKVFKGSMIITDKFTSLRN